MKTLSQMQIDAFTEIVNIGVGKAASLLNDLVNAHISLNVPEIQIVSMRDFDSVITEFSEKNTMVVSQEYSGDYHGSAMLALPSESATRLIAILTGDDLTSPNIDSVRSGTLMEIGNIVINAIIGTICNQLDNTLDFSLPEYFEGDFRSYVRTNELDESKNVMIWAKAEFLIKELQITGYIMIVINLENLNVMIEIIDRFLSGENDV